MKNSNKAWLELEVLEDRVTPGGAFSGGISAGPPPLPPFVTGLQGTPLNVTSFGPAFRNTFPTTNQFNIAANQAQTLQSQLQAFQAAQTAIIDQYFANLAALVKTLNLSTFLII
jgi:hypothetical protein